MFAIIAPIPVGWHVFWRCMMCDVGYKNRGPGEKPDPAWVCRYCGTATTPKPWVGRLRWWGGFDWKNEPSLPEPYTRPPTVWR